MAYTIEILSRPQREIKKLSPERRSKIIALLESLALNPRPSGVKKLKGVENRWALRSGDYRIVYEIHDDRLIVLVIDIDHRRQVYRR
ncbi:MAG: type II toxin-antitoxin system RelE/ParE family toxin [Candidatus Omnitrophota bacterium]